jgi:hypothetical protein
MSYVPFSAPFSAPPATLTHRLRRWSQPFATSSTALNGSPTAPRTPRQTITPGLRSLRALTGTPSCATGARRAGQSISAGPSGSAFPPETGSVFLLGIT